MLCYRGLRAGSLIMTALSAIGAIALLATAANAEPIVVFNGTTGSQTLYSYNLATAVQDPNGEGNSKFLNDTTSQNFQWTGDGDSGSSSWLQPTEVNVAGTVTWHFRAASGNSMAKDVAVKWNEVFFDWSESPDTTAEYINAHWSTDGTTWTSFASANGAKDHYYWAGATTSLSDSGFNGGTDLYLRFTVYRTGEAQLFRSDKYSGAGFVVSGTVSAIPEPTTAILLGSGVLGLMAYAWRKRK